MDRQGRSGKKERLEHLKTRLSGIGRDPEVKELFDYIAGLEEEFNKLGQYYEEFVIPDLERTWGERLASEREDRDRRR
jgi:hypothetical protein